MHLTEERGLGGQIGLFGLTWFRPVTDQHIDLVACSALNKRAVGEGRGESCGPFINQ